MTNLTDLQKIKAQVELQIFESSTSVQFIDEYLRNEVPEQFKQDDLMFNKGQLAAYENLLKIIEIIEKTNPPKNIKSLRNLSQKELKSYTDQGYLTVGNLKQFITKNNLSDEAPVLTQRVHDFYFENNNWGVYPKVQDNEDYPEEYIPIWCPVKYPDEEGLFLDCHY
jgi:hypothetical protein